MVKKDPADYVDEVTTTIDKCLTRTKNVVVSLIIDREDSELARARAKAVNGLLQVKYVNEPRVFLCEHDNLRDSRNRKGDKLHLNDMGTAKFANNLKHKIAEAFGITVIRKQSSPGSRGGRYNNNNS